jgi:response regulator RpfG family c-di-GMP phosphodiesterase
MDYIPQSVKWLTPEELSPCDIFLHFRGQYAIAVSSGQPFTIPTLTKFAKAGYAHVYVRLKDLPAWNSWVEKRHPIVDAPKSDPRSEEKAAEAKSLYGNKRAELQSYLQKVITGKNQGEAELRACFDKAMESIQRVCKSPMLDWYFQQFHEPPDLFNHNGRVAYASALFCYLHGLGNDKVIDNLVFSALIHELEGDPATSLKSVVSQTTLASLERNQRPVPQEVIALIRLHDELCSGAGFPNNRKQSEIPIEVRVFTLFNHFDHYRLQATGTRRVRYDRVKQQMMARKQDYDASLLAPFWELWDKHVELVG